MTSAATIEILGVPVSRLGMEETLQACSERLKTGRGGYVCFANVHNVTESTRNPDVAAAFRGAWLAVADGIPLLWAAQAKKSPISSRVCGPDFMKEFLRRNPNLPQGFLGGSAGQGERIAQDFQLTTAFCHAPPVRSATAAGTEEDWNQLLAKSGGKAPSVVWVGLGSPKQDLWMSMASRLAPETLFFGVGAAFDFLTDTKSRAPEWMQERGLEWFYRLSQEPGRLWKRYLVTNSLFAIRLAAELARGK